MTNILRFIQIFALGTWVGSIFYFSAAVAPGAFRVLSNPDQAGAIVQFTLGRLHMLGVVAAVLYLFASVGLAQSIKGLVRPAAIGVMLMLLLTLTSQRLVTPKLAALLPSIPGRRFVLRRERLVTRSGRHVRVPASTGSAADAVEAGAASRVARRMKFQRSAICSKKARKSWCRLRRNPLARKARASPATSRFLDGSWCTCRR